MKKLIFLPAIGLIFGSCTKEWSCTVESEVKIFNGDTIETVHSTSHTTFHGTRKEMKDFEAKSNDMQTIECK
jgi:hypothetical protein